MHYLKIKYIILFILFLNHSLGVSQGGNYNVVEETSIKKTRVDIEKWENLSNNLKFIEKEKPKDLKIGDLTMPNWISVMMGGLMYLIIGLVIFLLIYILILILKGEGWESPLSLKRDRIVKRVYTIEDLSHDTPLTELNKALDNSLNNGNNRELLRIQYLITIRNLINSRLIKWRKNKTNYDYINELAPGVLRNNFTGLTIDYERVWYGGRDINVDNKQNNIDRYSRTLHLIKTLNVS